VGASLYGKLSGRYSVFAVNFTRALFALPFFVFGVLWIMGGPASGMQAFRAISGTQLAWFVASMVCSYGLGDAFFMWSTRSLGAPGALAVASVYPLWTTIVGLTQGEKLSGLQFVGVLLTVAGVVTVILHAPGLARARRQDDRRHFAKGVFWAFATSVLWCGNLVAVSHIGKDLDVTVVNTVRMAMALFLAAGFSLALAPGQSLFLPRSELARSAPIFVLESVFGSALFIYGVSHSSLALGSTLSSLAPVISVPVALALGMEAFAPARALGICGVVGGLALLVTG
jgi:drug/metabolite transporter (DMT)-like permease